jgi:hypothetical protein
MERQQWKTCHQLGQGRMFGIHPEIAGLPITVTGRKMKRFV